MATLFHSSGGNFQVTFLILEQTVESVIPDTNAHGVTYSRAAFENLWNLCGVEDVIEDVNLYTQANLIETLKDVTHHHNIVTPEDERQVECTTAQQLKGFAW